MIFYFFFHQKNEGGCAGHESYFYNFPYRVFLLNFSYIQSYIYKIHNLHNRLKQGILMQVDFSIQEKPFLEMTCTTFLMKKSLSGITCMTFTRNHLPLSGSILQS